MKRVLLAILAAVLCFAINEGAYMAESMRAALEAVPKGQLEAGYCVGMSYWQIMRRIILPQAFKNILPSLANEFIVLLKETSIAGYVGVTDLTRGANIIRGVTYQDFMPLIGAAVIYLVMVMFFTWLVGLLERSLRKNER